MGVSELVVPFVGALQAAFSVLLTIFYGVLAAQFNLLSGKSAKEVSNLCVKMLLPALLIVKVGTEVQQGTALRYLPILRTSLACDQLRGLIVSSVVNCIHFAVNSPGRRSDAVSGPPQLGDASTGF